MFLYIITYHFKLVFMSLFVDNFIIFQSMVIFAYNLFFKLSIVVFRYKILTPSLICRVLTKL